ncbi:DNA polymerase III subunit delta [Planctomycetota bacterium]|nr:DNA polymerase III subunit delta [Planctomycetota bacterium]
MPKALPAADFLKNPDMLEAAPIYAVFGAEDFLRRRCLATLTDRFKGSGMDVRRVDLTDNATGLLDELRSASMFGDATAFVVRNQRVGNQQEASTKFKEEFAAYLEKPSKTNILIFDGKTWARNLTVPKRLGTKFPTIQCEELKSWDQRGWSNLIDGMAREHQVNLDRGVPEQLREYVGGNLARADSELAKLALMAENGAVTAKVLSEGCGYDGQDVTFPLCDSILTGDSKTAVRHAAVLAGKAEVGTVLSLLALLRLQVLALGKGGMALMQGCSGAEAIKASGSRIREAFKGGFLRTAKNVGRSSLENALCVLADADEAMKSTSPDPQVLVLGVVSRLCEILHLRKP